MFMKFDFIFDKMERWVGAVLVKNSASKADGEGQ